MGLSLYPLLPPWLILAVWLAGVVFTIRAYARGRAAIGLVPRRVLLALRLLSLTWLAVMLLCPGRVRTEKNLDRSQLVFLLDRSGSMGTRDLPLGRSRLEAARDFLAEQDFPRLAEYPRHVYAINHGTSKLPRIAAAAELEPAGGTDFAQAFDRVDKDLGLGQVAAVVLLSDGLDHAGNQLAAPGGTVVFGVIAGTGLNRARDLGIETFRYPARISDREELQLEIPVRLSGGAEARDVRLAASIDGVPLRTLEYELLPGQSQTRALVVPPLEQGLHLLRLEVARLEDEASYLNNERELALEVVAANDELAACFPLLTASFRPLLREFQNDADIVFTAFYRVSGDAWTLRGSKVNRAFAEGIPDQAATLSGVTCLALDSFNGELLSLAEQQVLERYVDDGGTLLLLGGADSFGELPPGAALARLSPVRHLARSFREGTYRVAVSDAIDNALTRQVQQLIAANQASPEDFVLRGLNQVREVKPNAQVLLWAEDGTRQPLLVWQAYGQGKVVALLSNSFHLWGSPETRKDNYGALWRQLLAFSRNVDESADLLRLGLAKSELNAGEPLSISATAQHPDPARQEQVRVHAELFPRGGDAPLHSLDLHAAGGAFTGDIPGLEPGRYVLKVAAEDGTKVLRERYRFILVGEGILENSRLAVRTEDFLRLASEQHLYHLDAEDPEAEAARLQSDVLQVLRKNEVRREQFVVFESPVPFAVLVLLLLAEWLVRRRYNLF